MIATRAGQVAVGVAFAMTLMACYGGPPRDLPDDASSGEPDASGAPLSTPPPPSAAPR